VGSVLLEVNWRFGQLIALRVSTDWQKNVKTKKAANKYSRKPEPKSVPFVGAGDFRSCAFCCLCQNRKPVTELLQQVFSSTDDASAAKMLKQLCLGELADVLPMPSALQFVAGDAGGVKVIVADRVRLVPPFLFRSVTITT